MTLQKLIRILEKIQTDEGIKLNGCHIIGTTRDGEVCLMLNTQPDRFVHQYLMKVGFVLVDGEYIYRPVTYA